MAEANRMTLMELPNALPPSFDFAELVQEVSQANIPWARHYSEYQSGDWWTCSLLGRSADARDVEVTDAVQPLVTDALEKLPVTRKFIEDMGLQYMMVRLARLDPHGALWEHRDYQDLCRVPRQRIHLPLDTNPDAFLVSGGQRFHMGLASLQTFRPTTAHGACNAGTRARAHLILDVYEDEHLKKLLVHANPLPSVPLQALSAGDLAAKVRHLRKSLCRDELDDEDGATVDSLKHWERAVLGLYFVFAVREGELYAALQQVCLDNGDRGRADFWTARRKLVLGEGLHDG
jgi:hypothetical protein